ncbi:hypothetical protein D1872_328230 [compost metagenome]
MGIRRVGDIRQPHPGDQNPASIRTERGLSRIEIKTPVQLLESSVTELPCCQIQRFANHITRLINVVIQILIRLKTLRREHQHA